MPIWEGKQLEHKIAEAQKPDGAFRHRGWRREQWLAEYEEKRQSRRTNGTAYASSTPSGDVPNEKNGDAYREHADGNGTAPEPDYDLAAERSCIGAVLVDAVCFGDLATILQAGDFRIAAHAAAWRALRGAAATRAGRSTSSPSTIACGRTESTTIATPRLPRRELRETAVVNGNCVEHARIVAEKATGRQWADVLAKLQTSGRATDRPVADKIAEALELVAQLGKRAKLLRRATPVDEIDLADLMAEDLNDTWLLQRFLVKDQPAIVGGPKKVLKTSLLVDLAISLGTGTSFLCEFKVYHPVRTMFISGESGRKTLGRSACRVCDAKGIDHQSSCAARHG